jgi:hypothetical protein
MAFFEAVMYARYASTAGCAFGSIVAVGLLVGGDVVIGLDVDCEASGLHGRVVSPASGGHQDRYGDRGRD